MAGHGTSVEVFLSYVVIFCRALLLVVFAVSAASKVARRTALAELAGSLMAMRLVARRSAGRVALGVVVAEAGTAVLLVLPGGWVVAGFVAAAALTAVLTGAVVMVLRRGAAVPCRCFGASTVPMGRRHVVRNLSLLAAAVTGGAAALGPAGGHLTGLAVAAAGGTVVAVVLVLFDDVVALFGPMNAAPEGR